MSDPIFWLLPAATAVLSALLCRVLAHPRYGPRILDRPGNRSLHERPTPRSGGIAVLGALAAGGAAAWIAGTPLWAHPAVLLGAALLAAISLVDDVRGLPPGVRLVAQGLAAGALLWGGLGLERVALPGGWVLPLGPAGAVLALLFAVWMTNLYNFMDGMDGLAGGMGAIGFAALGLIAAALGALDYALAALLVAAANLGFLTLNFPPARLFMGDVGAIPLGFLAAAFALAGVQRGLFDVWVPVLVFSPFIADATVTLLRRLLQGERVWEAHRSHYYQRTVLLGWSHRKTALAAYAIMAGTAGSAGWVALRGSAALEVAVLLGWALAFLLLALAIGRSERRGRLRRVNPS